MARIAADEAVFPGIVGYDDWVLPAIENAIVAGHDIVFLGERGQAQTAPGALAGRVCSTRSCPSSKAASSTRTTAAAIPDRHPRAHRPGRRRDALAWLPADRRYGEKLATPDITIADLIGEVDPIKVAEGRYLADESTIHYGLIPRTNRGIFTMNELPDLAERIQVGLLNILEERDVQVRGYTLRLPLDLLVVASANPEDYTSRGRIITPLKDRLGSQIRTHYPRTIEHETAHHGQERSRLRCPPMAPASRSRPSCSRWWPSCRTWPGARPKSASAPASASVSASPISRPCWPAPSVALCGWASHRPRRASVTWVRSSPRRSARLELESAGEDASEERVVDRLMSRAIFNVFARRVDLERLAEVIEYLRGWTGGGDRRARAVA